MNAAGATATGAGALESSIDTVHFAFACLASDQKGDKTPNLKKHSMPGFCRRATRITGAE